MSELKKSAGADAAAGLERLATAILGPAVVKELERAGEYLGTRITPEQRRELLKESPQRLVQAAQLAASAVMLRQQTETAEAVRRNLVEAETARAPFHKGPVS